MAGPAAVTLTATAAASTPTAAGASTDRSTVNVATGGDPCAGVARVDQPYRIHRPIGVRIAARRRGDLGADVSRHSQSGRDVVGDQRAAGAVLRWSGQMGVVGRDLDAAASTRIDGQSHKREVRPLGGDDLQGLVPGLLHVGELGGLQRPPHLVVGAGGVHEAADVVDRAIDAAATGEDVVGPHAGHDDRRIEAGGTLGGEPQRHVGPWVAGDHLAGLEPDTRRHPNRSPAAIGQHLGQRGPPTGHQRRLVRRAEHDRVADHGDCTTWSWGVTHHGDEQQLGRSRLRHHHQPSDDSNDNRDDPRPHVGTVVCRR